MQSKIHFAPAAMVRPGDVIEYPGGSMRSEWYVVASRREALAPVGDRMLVVFDLSDERGEPAMQTPFYDDTVLRVRVDYHDAPVSDLYECRVADEYLRYLHGAQPIEANLAPGER